ncbi:hypothetical protein FA95DRAFT_1608596 [Auriscalpium vulgare]|uniref:Uncharacterized protein n=1 Tax=Auriscalpium vulgare TaxID=40419 RepID=A0ACB8RJS4_9AGAM|nr:hypothetical protein FA95DRAFT_1608596 [Auriscalpium vulgare]
MDGRQDVYSAQVSDQDSCVHFSVKTSVLSLYQHLLRHISSIQIKNFTPFPARDALTSALSQPAEQSQFNAFGNLSDDLDVALARKRTRKVSSTSVDTMRSLGVDGLPGVDDSKSLMSVAGHELRGRKRTMSRASMLDRPPAGASPGTDRRRPPLSGSGPTVRPHRVRTNSMASSSSSIHLAHGNPTTSVGVNIDHSQVNLERILGSRLVETFLTLTVPPRPRERSRHGASFSSPSRSSSPHIRSSPHSAPPARENFGSPVRSSSSPHSSLRRPAPSDTDVSKGHKGAARPPISSPSSIRSSTSTPGASHRKVPSGSVRVRPSSASSESFGSHPTPPHLQHVMPSVPNYFSAIHAPSTNLAFPLDLSSGYELAPWSDLAATTLRVQLWGKSPPGSGSKRDRDKGKQKAASGADAGPHWKIMEEWLINLADLVPLPDELAAHPSRLSSNALLVTLSPPGKVFYLPPPTPSPASGAPSISNGYSSDPEVWSAGDLILPGSSTLTAPASSAGSRTPVPARSTERASRLHGDTAKSASWQDLVKMVNLQSAILDTQQLLSKIAHDIDNLVNGDEVARLHRDVSERETRITDWAAARSTLRTESELVAQDIQARKEELRRRRELLALAADMEVDDHDANEEQVDDLVEARGQGENLQNRLAPVRVTLISTLSTIFPIELLSGPDLLYTILDVPLPIPLGATDPAPPLLLPSHKEVTEDSVATSLAYAALVVQLLATYLGKGLVYPITFCGSKSMIRDGISAMVGPRMFPLFSKGVDTYRFEYGVFLLNKDIELLMSEKNLRALDMRHTLPNLKNLLLTLTDGEGARLVQLKSPELSITGLESPTRPLTPLESNPKDDPKVSVDTASDANVEMDTPSSGSTTPKPAAESQHSSVSRMSFFGLSGFLRARYPSSSQQPSVKAVPEMPEGGAEDASSHDADSVVQNGEPDEEEERRTLRGVPVDGDVEPPDEDKHGRTFPTEKVLNAVGGGEIQLVDGFPA